MAVPELVKKLNNDHRSLEAAIAQERCRPQPDEKRIKDLKREKLRIKDRLSALSVDATH